MRRDRVKRDTVKSLIIRTIQLIQPPLSQEKLLINYGGKSYSRGLTQANKKQSL